MSKPLSRFLPGLTGLRALACLSILFYHLNQHRDIANLSYLNWGFYQFTQTFTVAVSFFFLIGGIYRSLPYWRSVFLNEPVPSTRKTVIDRFFRIIPAYYFAIIVSFFVVIAVQGYSDGMFLRLLSGLTFLSWLHPTTFYPVDLNGPLWFISYDMVGTLIIIAVMALITRVKKQNIPWVIAGSFIVLTALHYGFISLPFPIIPGIASDHFPIYNPFLFGLHFLFGIIIGAWYVWGEKQGGRASNIRYDLLAIAASLAIITFLWLVRDMGDFTFSLPRGPYRFPIVTVLFSLVLLAVPYTRYLAKWLDNALFMWVARMSYGVYLWHALIMALLRHYFFGDANIAFQMWLVLVVITTALTFLIAWPSYLWLEVWFMEWKKRRFGE